jgi:hypothetical protein
MAAVAEFRLRAGEHIQNDPERVAVVKKMADDTMKGIIKQYGFCVDKLRPHLTCDSLSGQDLVTVLLTNKFCEVKKTVADGWFKSDQDLVALHGEKFERRIEEVGADEAILPGESKRAYEKRMMEKLKAKLASIPEDDSSSPKKS